MWFWRFRRFVWRAFCIKRISCMLSCFIYGYPLAVEAAAGPLLGHSWAPLGPASGGHGAAPELLLGCPGASWGLLGPPGASWGCSWTASGRPPAWCSWRLLAAPGRSWLLLAAPGGSWPLLAGPGRSWPLVAACGRSPGCSCGAPGGFWLCNILSRQIPFSSTNAYTHV